MFIIRTWPRTVIEDGKRRADIDDQDATRILDDESDSVVIEFKDTLTFPVSSTHVVVNFDFKNLNGASFKIFLQTDSSTEIILHYLPIDDLLRGKERLCLDSDLPRTGSG